jgi:glycosyltransferase involved in cell wall biosynthesis
MKSTATSLSRIPLSVVVITHNAAKDIGRCLESVRAIADEMVVVDSGSSDDTVAIATKLGARVTHQDWLGYGPQKQFAVAQAQHDWILSLDADEALTPELSRAITSELTGPIAQAYALPRCNRFMGRWLRHGEGYPDWCVRLFNRHHAHWSDDLVHEHVQVSGSQAKLSGDLLHYSEQGLADYLDKQNRYTTLQAQSLMNAHKKAGLPRMVVSPLLRFIKFYFLRRGFLDGLPGLVHVLVGCWNSFIKYAKLRELNDRRKMTE